MEVLDYTPLSVNDIVFNKEESRSRLMEIIDGKKPFPFGGKNGLLIYGISGTGKTTLARVLPSAIESAKANGAELNCDPLFVPCTKGMQGVNLSNNIAESAKFVSLNQSGFHYFIFDEIDMLTEGAQQTLKTTMNTPNTIFVMTTNHLPEIDKGVVSRSILIEMNAADTNRWLPFAKRLLVDFGINGVSDSTVEALIRPCEGSARDILDTLLRVVARLDRTVQTRTETESGLAETVGKEG
jgi:replication-associated recombination protein RarA